MTTHKPTRFLWSFFRQISPALALVAVVAVAYVYMMQFIDHRLIWVPYLVLLFAFLTFASVGYGDIAPLTTPVRLLVILEIGQSFVMVIFGLSNINNIHISNKNQ